MQLYLGSNPLSKIEIVFQLNLLSHAIEMYSYSDTRPSKYNPKIYFGSTLQTISTLWIGDKNYRSSTTPNHDEVKTQKQVEKIFKAIIKNISMINFIKISLIKLLFYFLKIIFMIK